jgi:hypothetical protein
MRFQKLERYDFKDTPRKRAAFFSKQRREREAHPLFAEVIAEEQAQLPGVDEVMRQRAESFATREQVARSYRAQKWREARAKIAGYDEPTRTKIRELWNDAPYPADPTYLAGMLRDIERGRIALDKNPPWRPTQEEIQIGREKIARFCERLRTEQQGRSL